ncbi:peptide ABC transporter substrate-binding protein [Pelagibaculum spongiae]|uniref:Oligopeptide ABC transporter substrate-binding protein OppA n=1 Tax=Pelagibaculum spongiae TaxID=2080658 RepID=A0A2V1GQL4_9GAMM|nr:peptide ABC transporter substrate-binding protein [Pelagibaculum spongiae]PVZ66338.1 oligopeptide ABC transporter substrate-binding protein OppA [Pelagibaculum spongiae]
MKKVNPLKALAIAAVPAIVLALSPAAHAAKVPAGAKLADQQTLVRGNGTEPASLDPQKVEGVPGSNVTKDMFEGLVTQDADGNTIPGQAESWTVSEDNKVFTFKIRDNANWSNGEPVTAHDFVFGFQRAVDPATASRYAWFMEIPTIVNASSIINGKAAVDSLGVKAIDSKTFEVTLEQAVPYFIKMLAHQTMFPVPQKVVEKHGDRWTRVENIVSNGAFVLNQWVVNERIVLKRNPNYWNNKETVINQVTYLPIVSETAELNRYKANELDMTHGIPPKHFTSLKKKIPAEIKITPQLGTYYYEFNTKVKPFDDVRVRKALSYAINRDAITRSITKRGEIPAYTFTPEAVAGFTPPKTDYSQWTQKERMKKAHQLLKEAGYSKSNPLELNLLYNTSEAHKDVAVAVSYMWKALGVKTTLENMEWKTFLDVRNDGKFQVTRAGWLGDYNEPSTMLDLKTTTHGQNDGKYSNARYDEIMKLSRVVTSDVEREKLYIEAEQILAAEMPLAPIYQYVTGRLVKPHVGGYPMNNVEDNIYSRDLYITQ